jgi:PAS domain S-box-containing protein
MKNANSGKRIERDPKSPTLHSNLKSRRPEGEKSVPPGGKKLTNLNLLEISDKPAEQNWIAMAASTLLESDSRDEIFHFLTETISTLSGADCLIISEYDSATHLVIGKYTRGLDPFIEKINSLLGTSASDRSFYISDMEKEPADFLRNEIHIVKEGLYVLLNGKFPKSVCRSIEKLAGIEAIYTRGFVWKGKLYGGVSLGFKKGHDLRNQAMLETIINKGALALGRRYYEESMIDAEQKYRLLIDNQGEGIGNMDVDETFTFVNPAAEEIFGVAPGGLQGKSLRDFLTKKDFALVRSETKKKQQGGKSRYELKIIRPDGQSRDILVTTTPMWDTKGQFKGSFGIFRDISDRKRVEEVLARKSMLDSALASIATVMLNPDISIKEVSSQVLHHACALTASVQGCVSSIVPDSGENICHAFTPEDDKRCSLIGCDQSGLYTKGSDGLYPGFYGYSLNTREPFFTNDPFHHPAAKGQTSDQIPDSSFLSYPVGSGHRLLGLITLAQAPDGYTEEDLATIHRLAELYGMFLQQWHTNEALLLSELRYSSFINSTSDMVFIKDEAMRYIVVNAPLAAFFQKPVDQVVGLTDFELLPKEAAENCYASDRIALETTSRIVSEEIIGDQAFETTKFPVRLKNTLVVGGMIRDVTERRRAEREISKLLMAIEQGPAAVVITDTLGRIEYVNSKFTEFTEYSREEVIGKNSSILKSGEKSAEEYRQLWEIILAGHEWRGVFLNRKKSGELYWESASISPIKNSRGKVEFFIAIKQDITSRKQIENELITARDKAEENDRLKTAFLQNISHEIRTPLNGILGFTELLIDSNNSDKERQEYSSYISQSVERLLAIISNIVSIATIEAGQEKLHQMPTDVLEVLQTVHKQFESKIKSKKIALIYDTDLDERHRKIFSDEVKLTQILGSLVSNAAKFTFSGRVEFGCNLKNDDLLFYVRDTGIGISEEMHKKIFERFRQGDNSATRKFDGAGLGLAISKAYVELFGGHIWLESEPGKGSAFYFTVPYHPAPVDPPAVTDHLEKRLETATESSLEKARTVLIAEDAEVNYWLLKEYLSEFNVKILRAENGLEAVESCTFHPEISLVIMDIKMPVMDGYEATRLIKQMRPDLPVISQTAYALDGDREKSLLAGCDDYITKPIKKSQFIELVLKYL